VWHEVFVIRGSRKLSLERTVSAPAWGSTIPEHLAYLGWHLAEHPETLETFFQLADDHQRRKPGKRFSASDAFAVMRWNGNGVSEDVFAVNNNLLTCYARLYLRERPKARALIEVRGSWLDTLDAGEWAMLDLALARGRAKLEARNPPQD
jgi:hypothetical protein